MSEPLISVSDLAVGFYNRAHSTFYYALKDINFTLGHNRCLGIIGESGSGKSITLLSLIGLMNAPPGIVSGKIQFSSRNETSNLLAGLEMFSATNSIGNKSSIQKTFSRRKKLLDKNYRSIRGKEISIIFQNPKMAFNPYFSVGEQICEMIQLHTNLIDKKEITKKALYWLERVGMDNPKTRFHNNPYGLSGGLCQRAMIAMALASEPSLLIADEPTTGLDTILQNNILNLLHNLQSELGLSMIIVSHDLGVIKALCDDVLVYHSGTIIEQGATHKVLNSAENKHPYTRQLIQCEMHTVCLTDYATKHKMQQGNCPYYNSCDEIVSQIAKQCASSIPALNNIEAEHAIRCWKYHDH